MLPEYDYAVCCGDVVGYGTDPEYCIDFIMNNQIPTVKGNHDAMATGECPVGDHPAVKESMEWTQKKLTDRYKNMLHSLPEHIDFLDLHLIHTLGEKYIYAREDIDDRCMAELAVIAKTKIIIGHSHVPFSFEIAGKTVVNPSSITKGRRGHPRGYVIYDGKNFEFIVLDRIAV